MAYGIYIKNNSFKIAKTGDKKNAEMLKSGNRAPVTAEDVEYFPGAKGYFARPDKEGTFPGVVMIHDNHGLGSEIMDTAEQLAREGYFVLAVDLYDGKSVESQDEARELTSSFNQETGTENMKAAVAYLRKKGATKIASLGWCFGGRQSIELHFPVKNWMRPWCTTAAGWQQKLTS